jgi:hypothetical protein
VNLLVLVDQREGVALVGLRLVEAQRAQRPDSGRPLEPLDSRCATTARYPAYRAIVGGFASIAG